MGVSFGGAILLCGGGPIDAGVVSVLTVGNTLLVAVAEQLLPRIPTTNLLRDRQSLNDMAHGVVFTFLGRPAAAALSVGLVAGLASVSNEGLALWPREAPLLAQLALAIVAFDLGNYVFHRSLHRSAWLWPFHALHHDTRQLHLLKSGRLHFGEQFLQVLVVLTPLLILGCPSQVMLWLALWTVFEGNLAHSNLDQRFPSWLHYAVPNVRLHALHHAEARALQEGNFGGLPLWDLVFGTFVHPDAYAAPPTGLEGDPVPAGFVAQLLYPFGRAARSPSAPRTLGHGSIDVCARSSSTESRPASPNAPTPRRATTWRWSACTSRACATPTSRSCGATWASAGVLGHEFVGSVESGPDALARARGSSARSTSPAAAARAARRARAPLPDAAG